MSSVSQNGKHRHVFARPSHEVEAVHDLIEFFLGGELEGYPAAFTGDEIMQMEASRNVLCWLLGHTGHTAEIFATNVYRLGQIASDAGLDFHITPDDPN